MHWILQNDIFKEDAYQKMVDTLERFNISYSIHKVIPFVGELVPEITLDHKNVICMGSYSLRHLAKKNEWAPGVYDLEPHDFNEQLKHWGNHMLNYDSQIVPFQDAVFTGLRFIRPIQDSKVFAGQIIDGVEFEEWRIKVCVLEEDDGTSLRGNTVIQVCTHKEIYSEHRFWIVGGKIITASTYKTGDRIFYNELPDDSVYHQYVEDRISEWQPLDAFVIDVADTDEGIKIVEINTLNSAGYYAADMQKLVMALEDFNGE